MAHILVAEDDIVIADFYDFVLKASGHEVTIAENGEMALKELQKKNYSLLITDQNMPLKGGIDLIADIRRDSSLKQMPIILVSGSASEISKDDIADLKINGTLTKPIKLQELLKSVKSLLTVETSQ